MADNGGGYSLEGYVEVHTRIQKFYEKYPDGSLQGRHWTEEVGGKLFVVYRAEAYRTQDDKRPGIGTAWEPFPGLTPFTKDSEVMVGETSAWGRALAALGFEVHSGIASAQEVRNRSGARGSGDRIPPSDKQLDLLVKLAKAQGADVGDQENIRAYALENLKGGREGTASKAIDALMVKKDSTDDEKQDAGEAAARLVKAAAEWTTRSDVPADDASEPELSQEQLDEVPFS